MSIGGIGYWDGDQNYCICSRSFSNSLLKPKRILKYAEEASERNQTLILWKYIELCREGFQYYC